MYTFNEDLDTEKINILLDPCEQDLLDQGYKSLVAWNHLGRIVIKGKKGIYLPNAEFHVFSIFDTKENKRLAAFFIKKRINSKYQNCPTPNKKNYIKNKDKLMLYLFKNNFKYINTISNVWTDSFHLNTEDNSLFILFRKNGIDIKYYDGSYGSYSSRDNTYSFNSGYRLSLNYRDTPISIFYFIVQIISVFKIGGDIKYMMQNINIKNSY